MRRLRDILGVVLLAVTIAFVGYLTALARRAAIVAKDLPEMVRAELRLQGSETRQVAVDVLERIRLDTLAEARATRRETLQRIDRLTVVTEASIERLTVRVDSQMTVLNANLDAALHRMTEDVHLTLRSVDPAARHLAGVAGQFDAALPMFLDCELNPKACLYRRYDELSRSATSASVAFAETAPPTLEATRRTSEAVAVLAERWAKQPPLAVRVLGWFAKIGMVFLAVF